MRSVCIIAVAFLSACGLSDAAAAVEHLSTLDRAALEHPQSVQMLHSTRAVPATVKTACAAVISDHRFWLADPGKPYNEACDSDDRIADRRLIWAARLPEHLVLHYESGGRAHGFHVIVVRLTGSTARVVWRASADEYKDYPAFIRALKRGKPDDTLDYMF
jgi:hypothetical protein